MRNQNIIFFAVSGFLVFLTIAVIWKDYNREWKPYQRTFYKMQADLAKTEEEKKEILNQKVEIRQIILEKDINDMAYKMSTRKIQKMIDENTVSGLEATLRFRDWKKV